MWQSNLKSFIELCLLLLVKLPALLSMLLLLSFCFSDAVWEIARWLACLPSVYGILNFDVAGIGSFLILFPFTCFLSKCKCKRTSVLPKLIFLCVAIGKIFNGCIEQNFLYGTWAEFLEIEIVRWTSSEKEISMSADSTFNVISKFRI